MLSFDNINLLKGNTAAGIHLNINADSSWLMSIVLLERKKNLIHLSAGYTNIESFEELKKYIPFNLPVILSVEGKGVIHKKIVKVDKVHFVHHVFQNARPDDFYVQAQPIANEQHIVSLIRNDVVREIQNSFRANGFVIYNIFLGPFSMNGIWTLFDQQQTAYTIDNYVILKNEEVIGNLEMIPNTGVKEKVAVCNEELETCLIIPYANALSFFSKSEISISFSEDICLVSRDNFLYKKAFRLTAATLLVVLVLVLLVNFLVFDNLNKRFLQASMQYKSDLELVGSLDSLRSELNLKETLIEENSLMTGSRYSYYADRIAALVPQQIVLTGFEINPLFSKPNSGQEMTFKSNFIKIRGKCLYSLILDEWMEVIRNEVWVQRMEVLQYQQENKGTPGEFLIQIEF